jgi:cell division septal protein FtsQ
MSWRAGARSAAAARPIRRPRRSPGWRGLITLARVIGLAVMVASAGSIGWLVTDRRFALDDASVAISGLRYTDAAAVRAAIGLPEGSSPNVFLLHTSDMRRALATLPAVASARVEAILPDRLEVAVTERTPVVAVHTAAGEYLVDSTGAILYELGGGQSAGAGLPLVDDERRSSPADMAVGGTLDQVDLAAILQLAAVTPATVGSVATSLALSIDDTDGYVLTAEPGGWRAVFGQYTANLRSPDLIARQVQCLRSLLASGESDIVTVYLSPLEDRCGTYVPRATPSPTPSG